MKGCTDIEQSKALAEFLPLESADMYWWSTSSRYYIEPMYIGDFYEEKGHIRAWSLAALFNYLREIDFFPDIEADEHRVTMNLNYYYEEEATPLAPIHNIRIEAESFIDACYEMIIKLKENNLI